MENCIGTGPIHLKTTLTTKEATVIEPNHGAGYLRLPSFMPRLHQGRVAEQSALPSASR